MRTIRIGNDISFVWKFYAKDGAARVPYDIEDKDVKVVITDSLGRETEPSITKQGNAALFALHGKDQKIIGEYTLTLFENAGELGMKAIDKISPFRLVAKQESVISNGGGCVYPTLDIVAINLDSDLGQSGNYDDLTNKPSINGVTLQGDKTLEELGIEQKKHSLSVERLRPYLYRVTFDRLPEDNGSEGQIGGGCSSYVAGGKLYTNLDWDYDNTASFIVRTKDFDGQSFIKGLDDGAMSDELIAQLPYRIHRGINNYGIKVATHIIFNDWSWTGCGSKSISLTRLPFLILSRVKSMATIARDLDGILGNLYAPEGLAALDYLLQIIVTDGTTTYALIPPTNESGSYELVNATAYPKMANFRYVARAEVSRYDMDLQTRPTGIERFNAMPCPLKGLRFTKAYEAPTRLSEFIGLRGTTKDSSDAELEAIYTDARAEYLQRERDGKTWQTMESAVYGDRLEALYIQEDWSKNIIPATTEYVDKADNELQEAIAEETQRATAKEAELEAAIAQAGKVDDVEVDDISVVTNKVAKIYTRIKGFAIGGKLHLELSHNLNLNNGKINVTSPYAHIDGTTHKIYI